MAAQNVIHLYDPREPFDRCFSDRCIRADRVGIGADDGHGCTAKAEGIELVPDRLEMGGITFEYRDFDAVKAGLLQVGKDREMILRDV